MALRHINITNVSSDIGSVYAGKSRASEAFRTAGLRRKLVQAGFAVDEAAETVANAGWVPSSRDPNGARNESKTVEACEAVQNSVSSSLKLGDVGDTLQLILSGECLYMPAILSAPSWFWQHCWDDSHASVSAIRLPGEHEALLPAQRRRRREQRHIVLFGLNTTSEANKREHLGWLFDHSFKAITANAVQARPVDRAEEALAWLEERVDYIVVHLDVDVIDPGEFPLCNVPNYTGLDFESCMRAVKVFLRSSKCVALSVAEVNPDHDPGLQMTERLLDEIVDGFTTRLMA